MRRQVAFDAHHGSLKSSVASVDQEYRQWQRDHPNYKVLSEQIHTINEPNSAGYVVPHYTLVVTYLEYESIS